MVELLILGWMSFGFTQQPTNQFKLLRKVEITGSALHNMIPIGHRKYVVANGMAVQLWTFDNGNTPKITASYKSKGFWRKSIAYNASKEVIAHANSTASTAILFNTIRDEKIFPSKILDFSSEYKKYNKGPTMAFDFSPNGLFFAYTRQVAPITIVDTKTYKTVRLLSDRKHAQLIRFLNDRLLLIVSHSGLAEVWDLGNEEVLKNHYVPLDRHISEGGVIDVLHNKDKKEISLVYIEKNSRSTVGICTISYEDEITSHFRKVSTRGIPYWCTTKLSPDGRFLLTGDTEEIFLKGEKLGVGKNTTTFQVIDISTDQGKLVFSSELIGVSYILSIVYLDNSTILVGGFGDYVYFFGTEKR